MAAEYENAVRGRLKLKGGKALDVKAASGFKKKKKAKAMMMIENQNRDDYDQSFKFSSDYVSAGHSKAAPSSTPICYHGMDISSRCCFKCHSTWKYRKLKNLKRYLQLRIIVQASCAALGLNLKAHNLCCKGLDMVPDSPWQCINFHSDVI